MRRLTDLERLAIADTVQRLANGFDQRLDNAWRLACDFHSDGHKASHAGTDGGRPSQPSDPTAVAAISGTDPADNYRDELTAASRNLANAITRWANVTHMITSHAEHRPPRESRVPQCVNRNCGDDVVLPDGQVPQRGRCKPCADYLERHDRDAPKSVIDGRRRVRKHRQGTM